MHRLVAALDDHRLEGIVVKRRKDSASMAAASGDPWLFSQVFDSTWAAGNQPGILLSSTQAGKWTGRGFPKLTKSSIKTARLSDLPCMSLVWAEV